MSIPINEPNFVTCHCQHCDGGIEFDASQAGETVACPHCGQETILCVPLPIPPPAQVQAVKGTILDYTIQTNAGIISGDDGKRYSFQGAEWREAGKYPIKGMRVDFSPIKGQASSIYLLQDLPASPSSITEKRQCDRTVAALLAIFLGAFGIHHFYLGKSQLGLIYIVAGIVTCTFGFFITALVGLVEGIIYLSMTQAEFERKYVDSPAKNYFSGFQSEKSEHSGKMPIGTKFLIGFCIFILVCILVGFIGAALSQVSAK